MANFGIEQFLKVHKLISMSITSGRQLDMMIVLLLVLPSVQRLSPLLDL